MIGSLRQVFDLQVEEGTEVNDSGSVSKRNKKHKRKKSSVRDMKKDEPIQVTVVDE